MLKDWQNVCSCREEMYSIIIMADFELFCFLPQILLYISFVGNYNSPIFAMLQNHGSDSTTLIWGEPPVAGVLLYLPNNGI